MKKINFVNTVTVLAGGASGGIMAMAWGAKSVSSILLATLGGAILAIIAISFDK